MAIFSDSDQEKKAIEILRTVESNSKYPYYILSYLKQELKIAYLRGRIDESGDLISRQ